MTDIILGVWKDNNWAEVLKAVLPTRKIEKFIE